MKGLIRKFKCEVTAVVDFADLGNFLPEDEDVKNVDSPICLLGFRKRNFFPPKFCGNVSGTEF